MSTPAKDTDTIWMHSHVSGRDGRPYVVMNWGPLSTQWTVEETVAHAMDLIECAHAAEAGALVAKVLGGDRQAAAVFLSRMREIRGSGSVNSQRRRSDVRHEDAG